LSPVPSLPLDDPEYKPWGAYWRGGVWPPTNYMVLCGLRKQGREDLARELAGRMFAVVETVFQQTGTFWENVAPEFPAYGNPSRPDFCGWSALIPIAVSREFLNELKCSDVGRPFS
ncbi:MAG: trehalase family glycosidase, partial [Kiritimatiellia bacterium]